MKQVTRVEEFDKSVPKIVQQKDNRDFINLKHNNRVKYLFILSRDFLTSLGSTGIDQLCFGTGLKSKRNKIGGLHFN